MTEDEEEINSKPKAEKDIWIVKRAIKVGFKKDLAAPKTKVDFYNIGRVLGKGAYGKVNLAM